MDKIPVGYKAISELLRLNVLPHYRESYIAKHGRGKTIYQNHHEIHIYPATYALHHAEDLLENLEFGLKYDGMNLEIIKSLFQHIEKEKIEEYIKQQPTGIWSRRIWFLYEFLMDDYLNLKDCQGKKYVDLVDSKKYFTGLSVKSSRHAINNNLLGNKQFCPFVRRTEKLEKYIALHLDEQAAVLLKKYDPHVIARACSYLFTKETMSSYQIEKEQPDKNRFERFISILQLAPKIELLTKETLIELQNVIVDPRFKDTDYRVNQNYIGENLSLYFQKIHYISPKYEDVSMLMQGLLDTLHQLLETDIHPVILAAVISFGFVFIHPFEDGNGRIHRFLIHYILSKKHFTPKNIIFPVSAIMLQNMHAYDVALESFSEPLLSALTHYNLSDEGILTVNQETKTFYEYIDFTVITEYLFSCIEDAVHNYLEREIEFLVNYDKTKKTIQEIVDMPDKQIDLFIKLVMQNHGNLSSQKQQHFFPLLTTEEIAQLILIVKENMLNQV